MIYEPWKSVFGLAGLLRLDSLMLPSCQCSDRAPKLPAEAAARTQPTAPKLEGLEFILLFFTPMIGFARQENRKEIDLCPPCVYTRRLSISISLSFRLPFGTTDTTAFKLIYVIESEAIIGPKCADWTPPPSPNRWKLTVAAWAKRKNRWGIKSTSPAKKQPLLLPLLLFLLLFSHFSSPTVLSRALLLLFSVSLRFLSFLLLWFDLRRRTSEREKHFSRPAPPPTTNDHNYNDHEPQVAGSRTPNSTALG